jgi:hypothetical protein
MLITFAIIGGIIVLLLLIGLLTPGEVVIEDTIIINKPVEQVFDYIRHMKNQDHYSTWNMMDPQMKKDYYGTDGQVGFIYKWDSSKERNVGAGEQEITAIVPNKSLDMELRFKRPMEDIAQSKFRTEAVGANQTKVMWGFYSKMKFPMTIMKPLMTGMLRKALVTGLQNLKTQLEK